MAGRQTGRVAPIVAWCVWCGVGLSLAFWVWQTWGQAPWQRVPPPAADTGATDPAQWARLWGAAAVVAEPASAARPVTAYVLQGVWRAADGQAWALIQTDGQKAKPYAVGGRLPGGEVLQRLAAREVWIAADGMPLQSLSLPACGRTDCPSVSRP